jgi:hypothetical protein
MTTTTAKTDRPTPRARKHWAARTVPHLSVAERIARGKAARAEVARSSHAISEPASTRADPVELQPPEGNHR